MLKDLSVISEGVTELLRTARNRAHLTQTEVARRIGLSCVLVPAKLIFLIWKRAW